MPTVTMTAGPTRVRMVHRAHRHLGLSLIGCSQQRWCLLATATSAAEAGLLAYVFVAVETATYKPKISSRKHCYASRREFVASHYNPRVRLTAGLRGDCET